ncbi:eCIS core domain-containing protein [Streptomyces humidus]|uniref:eCIS core domain-containing protein n=1 Tax=Streptomyces humidus TaxID=52259 RepID=UPI00331CBCED
MRNEMEARFGGADFSGVRVHDGPAAREAAALVEAKAFTTGQSIVDGGGMSRKDWAHELAHTRDQMEGPVPGVDNGAGLSISREEDSGERHAVDTADRVMQGPAPVQRIASGGRTGDVEQHRHGQGCGHNVQRVATGAVAVQRTNRATREDMEASRSAAALTRTARLLRSQGKDALAAKLEDQLDKSLPLPAEGTVAFANEMLVQQRHGRRYKLSLDLSTMLYYAAPHEGRKQYGAPEPANGKYNFVIPVRKPDKIMASQVGNEHEEGHSALAKATKAGDGHVYWAGTAVFTDGVLEKWTNDSGHYRPTGGDAGQVAGITGGFPVDKYKNFDDPGGAG